MYTVDNKRGATVVMLAHVAGMIDLVALPVWIGTLVQHYKYSFEQAGFTVTCFLLSVVGASLLLASRFISIAPRMLAPAGYGLAAVALVGASMTRNADLLLGLHIMAGAGVGCGLSITHGIIGRSLNPHKLFALAGTALGVFALLFYALVPGLITAKGGSVIFLILGGMMLIASIATSTFPAALPHSAEPRSKVVLSSTAWTAIAGVVCMTLSQSSVFSFLERVGVTRGFGPDRVNMLLAAIGLINLAPALLAGLLQHRLSPQWVAVGAALVQMTLGITITVSSTFIPYAAAASFYAFVLIFAHTFIFGLLARLDSSGRAVSLTPAMLMAGSALGPLFAGTVAQRVGFEGLAIVVMLIGTAATVCFVRVARNLDRIPEQSSASIARAS